MITLLPESTRQAIGFSVSGALTADDVAELTKHIDNAIQGTKKPIGLLVDLSQMDGSTWAARWNEMRFLHQHSDGIARIAIICHDKWEELAEMVVVATAFMSAETIYCDSSQVHHAWHWVKMNPFAEGTSMRVISPGKGLFKDYTPEYTGL
jgi:hypothetical protein